MPTPRGPIGLKTAGGKRAHVQAAIGEKVGQLVTEGKNVILQSVYNQSTTDRTTIRLGLMTNTSGLSATSVLADIAPVSDGGYSSVALTDIDWTIAAGKATHLATAFTASGAAMTGITGCYLYTTGATGRLINWTASGTTADTPDGSAYTVTPSLQLEDGALGITTDEGIDLMLNMFCKSATRTASITLSLIGNTGLTTTSVLADITKITGGGYADITIADGAWTISGGEASIAASQDFTASGSAFSAIAGYALASSTALLHVDYQIGNPIVADGDTYAVNLAVA